MIIRRNPSGPRLDNHRAQHTARQVKVGRSFGIGRPRRRMPRQLPPHTVEREYAANLLRIVTAVREALKPLMDELPQLLAAAARERRVDGDGCTCMLRWTKPCRSHGMGKYRRDADEGKRLRELVDQARRRLNDTVNTRDLEQLAEEFARRTSTMQRIQLGNQLQSVLGVDVLVADRGLAAIMDGFVAENVALIRNLPEKMLGDIERTVTRAMTSGTLHEDLAVELDKQFGFGEERAKLIARDQVGKFYGQVNATRQRELGVERFIWRTVKDERVRSEHEALEGEIFSYADGGHPEEGLPGEAINCFPGDTLVSSDAAVVKLFRRRYRGECTILKTDKGTSLQSTPNHPVLTARGWVAAQLVEVGDYVVEAAAQGGELLVANGQDRVAVAQEVFDTLLPLGRAEGRWLDRGFHGDASDEEVDVVDVDRCLRLVVEPELSQAFCQHLLARADSLAASPGPFQLLFDRPAPSAHRLVRGGGKLLALLCGRGAHALEHRRAAIAWLDSVANELGADGCAADAEVFRQALRAPTVAVEGGDSIAGVIACVVRRAVDHAARLDVPSAQELAQAITINAQGSRSFSDRVGAQQFARVVEKVVGVFSGHVYNLETRSSWYVARNLIVHNCRCSAEPVLDDILGAADADEGGPPADEPPPQAAAAPSAVPTAREAPDDGGGALTAQERQLLELRAQGLSDRKVTAALGVDLATAHTIASSVRGKLGLGDGGSLKAAGRRLRDA